MIIQMEKYKLNESFINRNIEGDMVFLNINTGQFYSIDEIGKFILEKFIDNNSLDQISKLIEENYDIKNIDKIKNDINEFLKELKSEKIIIEY